MICPPNKMAKKRIRQQVRFDAKPLGIGMCYCCGSILWSRVDNSHTRLVNLDVEDKTIPAVAYQHAMMISGLTMTTRVAKYMYVQCVALIKTLQSTV